MPLGFIISFSITLIGTYFCLKLSEEVPQLLTLTVTLVNFFLSLVFAPWWLQLLIIISILFSKRTRFL